MTARLRPSVSRRGYAVGAAQLRIGTLVHVAMLLFACAGVVAGTVAMADVVHTIARSL